MKYYRYRIWCDVMNRWETTGLFEENEPVPTTCPSNTAHAILASKTKIIETIDQNEVKIREEITPEGNEITGGHYQCKTIKFDVAIAPVNEWQFKTFTFPYPISLFSAGFKDQAAWPNDKACFAIAPNSPIGVLTMAVMIGDTVLNVSSTVIDYLKKGYHVTLTDGVNPDVDLHRVKKIDSINNTIEFEDAMTQAFANGEVVKMTIQMVPVYHLGSGEFVAVGLASIGGSYIPADTPLVLGFHNSEAVAKTFIIKLEYKY